MLKQLVSIRAVRYGLRTFSNSPPSIFIKTHAPLEVRAVWSDDVTFSHRLTRKQVANNNDYVLEEHSKDHNNETIKVNVPRRCKDFKVETSNAFHLSGDDKLEVEQVFDVKADKEIDLKCTVRASSIAAKSDGSIHCKSAVEGVKVELISKKGVAAKRIGAKTADVDAEGSIDITALYADDALLYTSQGNATLGSVHGKLDMHVENGNLNIGAMSGILLAEVKGDSKVHFELGGDHNSMTSGGTVDVTLAHEVLPIQIEGNAKITLVDEDVRLENGKLELVVSNNQEKPISKLSLTSGKEASISLLSWIDSVKIKAENRWKQQASST